MKGDLISNQESSGNSAHSDSIENLPRGIRRVFNMKIYELKFLLQHPEYVIPDEAFEKERNRILALDHPLIDLGM